MKSLIGLVAVSLLLTLSFAPGASAKKFPGEHSYRVMVGVQKAIATQVSSSRGLRSYIKEEAGCAEPILKEARKRNIATSATNLALWSSVAKVAQSNPGLAKRHIVRLYYAARVSNNPLWARAFRLQARHIQALLRMPAAQPVCDTLFQWELEGFTGLNELVDALYGAMSFQDAFLPVYKTAVRMRHYLMPRLAPYIGAARAARAGRSAYYPVFRFWRVR